MKRDLLAEEGQVGRTQGWCLREVAEGVGHSGGHLASWLERQGGWMLFVEMDEWPILRPQKKKKNSFSGH